MAGARSNGAGEVEVAMGGLAGMAPGMRLRLELLAALEGRGGTGGREGLGEGERRGSEGEGEGKKVVEEGGAANGGLGSGEAQYNGVDECDGTR